MRTMRGCAMRDAGRGICGMPRYGVPCSVGPGAGGGRPAEGGTTYPRVWGRTLRKGIDGIAGYVIGALALLILATGCARHDSPVASSRAARPKPAGPPVDAEPYAVVTPHLTLPPFLEERVIYHHSFSQDQADLNSAGFIQPKPVPRIEDGFCGPAARLAEKKTLTISGPALSPHAPITISFWWAIETPLKQNGGLSFFALRNNGRGYISNFVRGGPWCALKDSAYCFQLYNVPGIKNVHSNFDRQFRQRYAQGPDEWHHTVLTASLGNRLALFADGKRVGLYLLSGRALKVDDALQTLVFGQHNVCGLRIDELTVLDLALSDEQVARFSATIRSLKDTGHF